MDPKSFYGLSTKWIPKIPNDGNASDDPDMSDETASTSRNTVYASDSENERDNGEKVHAGMIIPESEWRGRRSGWCSFTAVAGYDYVG